MRLKKSHGLPLAWDVPVLSYRAMSFQCGFKPGHSPQKIGTIPGSYIVINDVHMKLDVLARFIVYVKAYPNLRVDNSAPSR